MGNHLIEIDFLIRSYAMYLYILSDMTYACTKNSTVSIQTQSCPFQNPSKSFERVQRRASDSVKRLNIYLFSLFYFFIIHLVVFRNLLDLLIFVFSSLQLVLSMKDQWIQ